MKSIMNVALIKFKNLKLRALQHEFLDVLNRKINVVYFHT